MIAVEFLVGLFVVTAVIFGIVKIGAPLANAFADRLRLKFEELDPSENRQLKERLAAVEEEVRVLKQTVLNLQETADFTVNIRNESVHEKVAAKK